MVRVMVVALGFAALVACGGGETVSDDSSSESDGECQNDLERCSDDGVTIERCIGEQWEEWTDCPQECALTEGEAECLEMVEG